MTTILAVRRNGKVAIGGDGQVTMGPVAVKHDAKKIRRLHDNQVLAGFAGSTADAMALLEKFEQFLKKAQGNIERASVDLAKEWRLDKVLRRLESLLIVADRDHLLMVSGSGDVLTPDDEVAGIGSGSPYATAAARALVKHTKMKAREIVEESLHIAAKLCIYTNDQIHVEEL